MNSPKVKWYNHLWFTQCVPKCAFVLWLTLKNKLMTKDRILQWNQNIDGKCVLCKVESESRNHLFFSMSIFCSAIWNDVKKLCSENWQDIETAMCNKKANGRIWSVIQRSVCSVSVYYIWIERNSRVFKHVECSDAIVLKQITNTIRFRLLSLNIGMSRDVEEANKLWDIR